MTPPKNHHQQWICLRYGASSRHCSSHLLGLVLGCAKDHPCLSFLKRRQKKDHRDSHQQQHQMIAARLRHQPSMQPSLLPQSLASRDRTQSWMKQPKHLLHWRFHYQVDAASPISCPWSGSSAKPTCHHLWE